jgi:hypothetical protein
VGKLCDGIECNHLVPQPIKKSQSAALIGFFRSICFVSI